MDDQPMTDADQQPSIPTTAQELSKSLLAFPIERYKEWMDPDNQFWTAVQWDVVEDLTLYLLSRRMTAAQMDDPDVQNRTTPIEKELAKRHKAKFLDRAPERSRVMVNFRPRRDPQRSEFDKKVFSGVIENPLTTDPFHAPRGRGNYTFAFKLNTLVAVTWCASQENPVATDGRPVPPVDPHPTHQIALLSPEAIEAAYPDHTQDQLMREVEEAVAEALSQKLGYRVKVEQPDEDYPLTIDEEDIVSCLTDDRSYTEALAYKESVNWPNRINFPSVTFNDPTTANAAVEDLQAVIVDLITTGGVNFPGPYTVVKNALTQAGFAIPPEGGVGLPLQDFKPQDIQSIVDAIPGILTQTPSTSSLTAPDMFEVKTRVKHHIQARVSRLQVSPCFERLPGMRQRNQTWSVSHDRWMNLDNVRSTHYQNCPDESAIRPVDIYSWAPIEVASPVFSVARYSDDIVTELQAVCKTLKTKFRAHHCALPQLDLTTSVFIGHTEGFTLLELKKLATVFGMIENKLATLHRRHRASQAGRWPCDSLRAASRLGAVICSPLYTGPQFDPDRILPHPTVQANKYWTGLMHAHLPVSAMLNNMTDQDELFVRAIWLYPTVSNLARALETTGYPNRLSLAIRCSGPGQRTMPGELTEAFRDRYPGQIDEYRGVVEFRQMGQNLDPEAIFSWTGICGKIVRTVRETNPVAFKELVSQIMAGQASLATLFGIDAEMTVPFDQRDSTDVHDAFYKPLVDGDVEYGYPFYRPPTPKVDATQEVAAVADEEEEGGARLKDGHDTPSPAI